MKRLALFFIMSVSVISVLFLFSGVKAASAKNNFFISVLSRVHGYRITKDYGLVIDRLNSDDTEFDGKSFVKYVRVFHINRIVNIIKEGSPGNACIDFRVSYQTVTCEIVTIVPKK